MRRWLAETANVRLHRTTLRRPVDLLEEESATDQDYYVDADTLEIMAEEQLVERAAVTQPTLDHDRNAIAEQLDVGQDVRREEDRSAEVRRAQQELGLPVAK